MFLAMIGWIVFGLIVGVIAKFLMPGDDGGGFVMTILLGVGGAIVGGFISFIFGYDVNKAGEPGFIMSFLTAIIGSFILLILYRLGSGRSLTA